MTMYRIKNWEKHFENAKSRQIDSLSWVPVPNKHDGEGFRTIMSEPDGLVIYGCWHLILQVASKCHPRGTLVRDDKTPHTSKSIAIKTGCGNQSAIQRTLDFCSSLEVGWIEQLANEVTPSQHPSDTQVTPSCPRTEGNGIELNGTDTESEPHKPVEESKLKTINGAVNFIGLHPRFKKISVMAIENVLKSFSAYREHWPKFLRQFQTDHAGDDSLKYPPCQQLRIDFDRYIKFNNIQSGHLQP